MIDNLDSWVSGGLVGVLLAAALLLAGCDADRADRNADDRGSMPAPVSQQAERERSRSTWGGAEIYDEVCDQCHKMGLDGAPELDDAAAWRPRIDKGAEVLYEHVLHGFNKMPARGDCGFCSDQQLREAMSYMIRNSGVEGAATAGG